MKAIHRFGSALAALVVALAGCSSDNNDANANTDACSPACGPATTCKQGQCVSVHAVPELDPTLQTFQNGWQVTAACLGCHAQQAVAVMQTAHWNWSGPTPDLMDSADPAVATTAVYAVAIGKKNLINNFCVAVISNEKRCDQCHAGYGGDPDATHVQKSARAYAYDPADVASTSLSSIPLEQRVDCLICHADLSTGYVKATANFGGADVKPAAGCSSCASGTTCLLDPDAAPSCYPMSGDYYKAKLAGTLAAAIQSIRKPDRENCGYCHFYAGGGDGVKLMGSSLKNPSRDVDVHMGGGMTCADCHAQPGHEFSGAGVHVPAHTSRASCEDCHGAKPHQPRGANAVFDTHAARIACQTCHIPTFARGQFAKVDWDWSTAGDKSRGVLGVVKETLTSGTVTSTVETYSFLKGTFTWAANITPTYRWYDGRMTHATVYDKADFDAEGTTTTDSNRITLGEPVGAKCSTGSKIYAFKLMRGQQAFYVDPASTAADPRDFAINPNVFGPGSLWGTVQSPSWTYSPAAMDALWSTILTTGARAAGQIGATDSIAKSDGTSAGWEFRTSKLYMDLNHEVAPKEQAIGATSCSECHGDHPVIPFGALGYPTPLPMANGCN